jgi:hypothetical protein
MKGDLTKDFSPSSCYQSNFIFSGKGKISIPTRKEKVGVNIDRMK